MKGDILTVSTNSHIMRYKGIMTEIGGIKMESYSHLLLQIIFPLHFYMVSAAYMTIALNQICVQRIRMPPPSVIRNKVLALLDN